MPGLDLLDVAIGVIFMYLLASLVCSAAVEFFEALMRFRGSDLEHGIRDLLQDDPALVKRIYDHPLVSSLYAGIYGNERPVSCPARGTLTLMQKASMWKRNLPSYIPARNFALAFMETLLGQTAVSGATPASPAVAPAATVLPVQPTISLGNITPPPLPALKAFNAVSSLVIAAQNDAAKALQNIEEWFNSGMDRVSGGYKRRTQYMLFIVGLIAAAALNLDSIGVAKALAANKSLRQTVVENAMKSVQAPPTPDSVPSKKSVGPPASVTDTTTTPSSATTGVIEATGQTTAGTAATTDPTSTTGTTTTTTSSPGAEAKAKAAELNAKVAMLNSSGLPIGWHNPFLPRPEGWPGIVVKILGILITGSAVSLGAPFWFDTLNKFIVVRSTVKPKEKSGTESSKDAQK